MITLFIFNRLWILKLTCFNRFLLGVLHALLFIILVFICHFGYFYFLNFLTGYVTFWARIYNKQPSISTLKQNHDSSRELFIDNIKHERNFQCAHRWLNSSRCSSSLHQCPCRPLRCKCCKCNGL